MKCEYCNKTIMVGNCYTLDDCILEPSHYCSPECAMKDNGIMRVAKRTCTHCGMEIGLQQAYVDEGDDLFCSMEHALAANRITKAFKAYDERKAKFAHTHKPCKCAYCGRRIHPGSEIWVDGNESIYCSADCGLYGQGGSYFEFEDDEYEDFFEKVGDEQ